jgi:hypothetical protein
MNTTKDILIGRWHDVKGQVRKQWGKLTDDDLARLVVKPKNSSASCTALWLRQGQAEIGNKQLAAKPHQRAKA